MTIQAKILAAIAASGLAAFAVTSQAHALTAQECSAKYQAAKTAGTLGDQKWNDFRKAQCGADATAAPAAATPAAAPAAAPKETPKEAKKEAAPKEAAKKEAAAPRHRQAPRSIRTRWIRNIPRRPPARPACTPASTNTTPTRPPMPMAG